MRVKEVTERSSNPYINEVDGFHTPVSQQTSSYKTEKVALNLLIVIGVMAFIYLTICEPDEHSYCRISDLAKVLSRLNDINSFFF